jgi:hypothetical protein
VLVPKLPTILDTMGAAAAAYPRRTLRALLDVLVTLASVVGPAIGDPALTPRFMPQVGPCAGAGGGGRGGGGVAWGTVATGLSSQKSEVQVLVLVLVLVLVGRRRPGCVRLPFPEARASASPLPNALAAVRALAAAGRRGARVGADHGGLQLAGGRDARPLRAIRQAGVRGRSVCGASRAGGQGGAGGWLEGQDGGPRWGGGRGASQDATRSGVALCGSPTAHPLARPTPPLPQAAGAKPPQGIPYEPDTYMAALDLLSGLADGLRASAEPLVAASGLVAALPDACRDEQADVRQSAFALVGDLARCAALGGGGSCGGCVRGSTGGGQGPRLWGIPRAQLFAGLPFGRAAGTTVLPRASSRCAGSSSHAPLPAPLPPNSGCPSHLLPALPQWVSLCLGQLDAPALTEGAMPACNNAAWALGELLMRAPADAAAGHAERVSAGMHFILSGGVRVTHGLRENAAITLGRVAAQAPAPLAPHLGHFLVPWCNALRGVRDNVEKEDAFRGLVRLAPLNVEAGWAAFPQLAGGRVGGWAGGAARCGAAGVCWGLPRRSARPGAVGRGGSRSHAQPLPCPCIANWPLPKPLPHASRPRSRIRQLAPHRGRAAS